MIKKYTREEIIKRCESVDITVAPIGRPEDLFDDPQLNQEKGGLLETVLPAGVKTKLPRMPIEMGDYDFGLRNDPPQLGSDTREVLRGLGYGDEEIAQLIESKVVVAEE
jgi:crotonobetainyl-CoA:carnitine CoA-transferase CaiB-like acyl-CoA transferase